MNHNDKDQGRAPAALVEVSALRVVARKEDDSEIVIVLPAVVFVSASVKFCP
jgi:hypothetical protein